MRFGFTLYTSDICKLAILWLSDVYDSVARRVPKDTSPRRPSHQGRRGEHSSVHGLLPTPGVSAPAPKALMAPSVPGHALIAGSRALIPPVFSVVKPRLSVRHNDGLELVHA
jgi:hypothetical protein